MTFNLARKTMLCLASLLLVGCEDMASLSPMGDAPVRPVPAQADIVSLRIAQAAEKAAGALDTIAGIDQYRTPQFAPEDYSAVSPELSQLITVKWMGPVEKMLEMLASRAGMSLEVKGNRPGVPLVVNVNVYQKPLVEVLRDLGLQVGRRADITVNSSLGMIGIRYAPVDRT